MHIKLERSEACTMLALLETECRRAAGRLAAARSGHNGHVWDAEHAAVELAYWKGLRDKLRAVPGVRAGYFFPVVWTTNDSK